MIVREMARQAPDTLSRNAALVMPLAFTARHDEDADVAELWKEVGPGLLPASSLLSWHLPTPPPPSVAIGGCRPCPLPMPLPAGMGGGHH